MSKKQTIRDDIDALMGEYLAKGGVIAKVNRGQRKYTEHQMKKKIRAERIKNQIEYSPDKGPHTSRGSMVLTSIKNKELNRRKRFAVDDWKLPDDWEPPTKIMNIIR